MLSSVCFYLFFFSFLTEWHFWASIQCDPDFNFLFSPVQSPELINCRNKADIIEICCWFWRAYCVYQIKYNTLLFLLTFQFQAIWSAIFAKCQQNLRMKWNLMRTWEKNTHTHKPKLKWDEREKNTKMKWMWRAQSNDCQWTVNKSLFKVKLLSDLRKVMTEVFWQIEERKWEWERERKRQKESQGI